MACERKAQFNLALVLQGVDRAAACDEVWLAASLSPRDRGRERDARFRNLCRRLGFALAAALALLLAPATALVAGIFLDEVTETVERRGYLQDPPGRALPWGTSLARSAKFLCVVVLVNAVAFALLVVPGVNLVVFLVANGYLLGREFFEFAAMRFRPQADARALRRRHAGTVFLAGLMIAAWLAVPLLHLTAPIFAAALMVHLHKALAKRS